MLSLFLLKIGSDDIAGIVFLDGRNNVVGLLLEGSHLVIAFSYIVDGSDAIVFCWVDGLAVDAHADELLVLAYHQRYPLAHSLTAEGSYLFEEFDEMVAAEGEETELVLEGSHLEDMTEGDIAGGQRSADASNVINAYLGMLIKHVASPYHDVRQEVREQTLWLSGIHGSCQLSHHGLGQTVNTLLIGCHHLLKVLRDRCVITLVYQDACAGDLPGMVAALG